VPRVGREKTVSYHLRKMRRIFLPFLVTALAAGAWVQPAAADTDPPRSAAERFLVARPETARTVVGLRARPGGRVVARLAAKTVFGGRPVLAVVRERARWLGVTTPELRNRIAWVPRYKVRLTSTRYSLEADLSERTLVLRRGGRPLRTIRVAIGGAGSPTPIGRFAVTDKFSGKPYGPYLGCCVLAFSGHQPNLPDGWFGGDRIGLHGTDSPASIGTASSAGCLRARDEPLRFLMETVPLGTPVFIHP